MSLRQKYGRERGIALAYIKAMGVQDVEKGISIPVRGPDGKTMYERTRLIPPRIIVENGKRKEQRFENPAGQSSVLNFLPLTNGMTWDQVLADPTCPIYFAESEFKAAAIAQLGYAAVTASSVMGHRDSKSGRAPCLDCISWHGRVVYIAFDNDMWFNPNVQDGLFDLAQELINRGASVEAWLLPRPEYTEEGEPVKLGMDDFTKQHGKKAKMAFDGLIHLPLTDSAFDGMGKYRSPPTKSVAASLTFDRRPMSTLTKTPPDRQYVVAPWFGKGQLAFLSMAGGGGKGFMELSLAVHVATGRPWFGMPVTQGRVAIVALEDSLEELDRRLHDVVEYYAQQRQMNRAARKELYATVLDNVRYVSVEGSENPLHIVTEENRVIARTPELKLLAAKLKALRPILTIFDPLSQLHSLNENDNSVGSAVVGSLGYLRKECDTAIVVMAHVSKAANKSGNRTADANRGASSFINGARSAVHGDVLDASEAASIFEVEPQDAVDRFAIFTHTKCNYGKKAQPLYLVRGDKGVWQKHSPAEIPFRAKAKDSTEWLSQLEAWMKAEKRAYFSKTDVTQTHVKNISNAGRTKAQEYFDKAATAGEIRKLTKDECSELPSEARQGSGARYRIVTGQTK